MRYHLLQVALSSFDVERINTIGREAVAKDVRHENLKFALMSQDENWKDHLLIHDYEHVANIEAASVDEAIMVGNGCGEGEIFEVTGLNKDPDLTMCSVSLGDILINKETMQAYLVDQYGLQKLEISEQDLYYEIYHNEKKPDEFHPMVSEDEGEFSERLFEDLHMMFK